MKVPQSVRRFFESRQEGSANPRSLVVRAFGAGALIVIAVLLMYAEFFGPPSRKDISSFEFLIAPEQAEGDIAALLEEAGLVRHATAFRVAHASAGSRPVRPGGYRLSLSMDAWTVADTLSRAPYLAWLTIPNGLRKEQVGELLSETLSWAPEETQEWMSATSSIGLSEGIFFPDTYLIPSDQTPAQVALRMQGRFEDAIAPYAAEASEKGLEWREIVILASLVEKEAARNDKELVAGILWNRIERGMLLQVDATLQYIRGEPGRWWPVPRSEDKFLESPFNTYQVNGLPPEPIASPSLDSLLAVLRPQETSCLYYLHDARARIHCSRTYAGHVDNINRFLR